MKSFWQKHGVRTRSGVRGRWAAVATIAVALLTGCGDDDAGDATTSTTGAAAEETSTTGAAAEETTTTGAAAEETTTTTAVEPDSLRIVVPADLPAFAQLYVAEAEGYYADENLTVTIEPAGAGNIIPSLLGGTADLAFIGSGLCVTIENQGADCTLVYNTLGGGAGAFMASRPDITEISECDNIAGLSPGSAAYGWALNYAEQAGVDPDIVPLQNPAAVAAAVDSGQVDCGVADFFGFAQLIEQDRVNVLVDTRDEDQRPEFIPPSFPEAGLFGMAENLEGKRDVIVRFIRAFHAAFTDSMAESTPAEVAEQIRGVEAFQVLEEAALVGQIEANLPFFAPNLGVIDEGEWSRALEIYRSQGLEFVNPDDETWSYDNLVDMSYYEEAAGG